MRRKITQIPDDIAEAVAANIAKADKVPTIEDAPPFQLDAAAAAAGAAKAAAARVAAAATPAPATPGDAAKPVAKRRGRPPGSGAKNSANPAPKTTVKPVAKTAATGKKRGRKSKAEIEAQKAAAPKNAAGDTSAADSASTPANAVPAPTETTGDTPALRSALPSDSTDAAGNAATAATGITPPLTTLVALIDVGWGNTLYVRGEGGGLSWDYGVPLTCRSANEWVWVAPDTTPVLTFKFLFNDIWWENSENRQATLGEIYTAAPAF